MPEHGTFPIHMQPAPHNAVLVTCNDYLGMLKLGHTSQPKNLDAVTHDSQLCGAIYNKTFKQVSICAVSYNCNSVIHLIMVALFFKNIEKTITTKVTFLLFHSQDFFFAHPSVCGKHLWPKTLTLVISFTPQEVELSYLVICIFLVARSFHWHQNFWPCDLELYLWPGSTLL